MFSTKSIQIAINYVDPRVDLFCSGTQIYSSKRFERNH